ncbi:hypothetical protein LCGC14_2794790, partial [marine sediment metagenome]
LDIAHHPSAPVTNTPTTIVEIHFILF